MTGRIAAHEVRPLPPSVIQPLPQSIIWLVVGPPTVTLVLVVGYWLQALLRNYLSVPTRQLYEIVVMLPPITIVSFLIVFVAQLAAYAAMTALALMLRKGIGRVPLWPLLLASPLLGYLTWFGYEHFVPEYRFFLDESPPYQYGLTLNKFLFAWGLEILIVLGFWWPLRRKRVNA